jgi:hypothetical protein
VPPASGKAATCDIDLMRKFHFDFTRSMPLRAVSHCTAVDLEPYAVPPRVVVFVTQMTRPKSRFAEIGERGILLIVRARARNALMVQTARPS